MIWSDAEKRNDPETRQGRIFQALKKLEAIRHEHPVFESAADTWTLEPYNDHILCIGRYYQEEKLLALFNFGEREETAWLNEGEEYTDLMTGEKRDAKAVSVPSHGFLWLYHSYKPVKEETPEAAAEPEAEAAASPAAEAEPAPEKKKAPARKKAAKKTEKKDAKAEK